MLSVLATAFSGINGEWLLHSLETVKATAFSGNGEWLLHSLETVNG